jgi:siderophore synthetase component
MTETPIVRTESVLTIERPDEYEELLVSRVLATMLREDVAGLRTRSTRLERPDGCWLRLSARGASESEPIMLPIAPDGFLCADAIRRPLLLRESDRCELRSCAEIVDALALHADPVDRAGFTEFAQECAEALAAMRLHGETRDDTIAQLVDRHGHDLGSWTGTAGLAFDTLAARHDHPVYPTSRARAGLDTPQLRSYAPEFQSHFRLRWLAVPHEALTMSGDVAALEYWPTPEGVGLPQLDGSHLLLPVHPLTAGTPLKQALRESDLHDRCVLVDDAHLEVIPTLSMRTVALADDPAEHLKLPLMTATLGRRNTRRIKPHTLADGALCGRLLETITAQEPRFRDAILITDENTYAHAGHKLVAVLRRRYPDGLQRCVVVPMAALLSSAPDGRPVLDHLADRFYGGDVIALFDTWLTLLFDWHTTLFGYGIALEAHQQNVSLVFDADGGTRLRMVFKDNDTPRVHRARLNERLGGEPSFTDPRITVAEDRPLTDMFTTITVHLCAGSYAFDLARLGYAPLPELLGLVRARLEQAIERLDGAAAQLRADVLAAASLPVKAMVSAGTLFDKQRSGATDINTHYTHGPNYLRTLGGTR